MGWLKKLIADIRHWISYKKRMKEMKKRDPFIY